MTGSQSGLRLNIENVQDKYYADRRLEQEFAISPTTTKYDYES